MGSALCHSGEKWLRRIHPLYRPQIGAIYPLETGVQINNSHTRLVDKYLSLGEWRARAGKMSALFYLCAINKWQRHLFCREQKVCVQRECVFWADDTTSRRIYLLKLNWAV